VIAVIKGVQWDALVPVKMGLVVYVVVNRQHQTAPIPRLSNVERLTKIEPLLSF